MRFATICCILLFIFPPQSNAQDPVPQRRRAGGLPAVKPHWISPTRLWIRSTAGTGVGFHVIDADKKSIRPAFDVETVARLLSEQLQRTIDAQQLNFDSLNFDGDDTVLTGYGARWRLNRSTGKLQKLENAPSVAGTLPVSVRDRPSRRTGGDTAIVFENRLNEEVVISWSDPEGGKRVYGTLAPGKTRDQHTFAGDVWVITNKNGDLIGVFAGQDRPGRAIIDGREPDTLQQPHRGNGSSRQQLDENNTQRWQAFCRDHNLWLRDTQSDTERRITHDGSPELTWQRSVIRDRGIHMRYDRPDAPPNECEVYWSPNGQSFVAIRTHIVPLPFVKIIQSNDRGQQPKLVSYPYFKPGDKLPRQEPRLFHAETGLEIVVSNELFPNPFEISRIRWAADSSRFTFLYNERGHQVLRHLAVDARSGKVTAVCDERSQTFIDYSSKFFVQDLPQTDETIWMSERDGWNHLYLFDSKTGQLKNQITQGAWVVRGVEDINVEDRQVFFRAGGIHPEQDPYHVHFCRINFDGSELTKLTQADGTHDIELGPGGRFFFDTYSRVDMPPRYQIRSAHDGSLSVDLPIVEHDFDRPLPQRFIAKGRDGRTDIYGIIHFPVDFDPGKAYPVIENIYAGPHSAHVPKSFRTVYRHQHQIADKGFIIVQIDGMGTSHRSKAFHDVCWKNIADAGLPDRIRWIKAAAAKFPFMDVFRVGIYGGSAGGQNAMGALLHHGDFYKVAVADCGCHDNRMDKLWWNEQWMGIVGPHYDEQSNVTNAHKLEGKLLLVVGEVDKNVDPASTMQVVNALIKADKDFDFLIVPGGGHGIAESRYGSRRRAEFFVTHLGRK